MITTCIQFIPRLCVDFCEICKGAHHAAQVANAKMRTVLG